MRERPTFDELEAPPPTPSRIDGLTDEEWARRRIRNETVFRAACGVVFGAGVALLAIWHWMLFDRRAMLAASFVVVGCVVLFAVLFARRRDFEAMELAQWISFTEWKFVERLPWWALVSLIALGAAVAVGLLAIVLLAVLSRHL